LRYISIDESENNCTSFGKIKYRNVTNSTFISMDSSSKRFNLKIRVSHSTSVRHYAYRYHDGTLQYKEQKDDIVTKSFFGIKIGRKKQ